MTMNEKRRDLIQKFAALGSLVVLIAVFAVTSRAFFTTTNALTVALQACTIAYLGVGMTDRVVVFHEGRVAGVLETGRSNQEEIIQYASGQRTMAA